MCTVSFYSALSCRFLRAGRNGLSPREAAVPAGPRLLPRSRAACFHRGGHLLAAHAPEEVPIEGAGLAGQFVGQGAPAAGVRRAPALDRLGEAQARGAGQVVHVQVGIEVQVQLAGRRFDLIAAPPAVFAGAAAKGRQAKVVAATHGLGAETRQIVGAGLGPDGGFTDAIGLGHDPSHRPALRQMRTWASCPSPVGRRWRGAPDEGRVRQSA